jgi:hypothetical protein
MLNSHTQWQRRRLGQEERNGDSVHQESHEHGVQEQPMEKIILPWRQKEATGDVIVVRYADDLVVGFENRTEAERFLKHFGNGWPSLVWNNTRRKHD